MTITEFLLARIAEDEAAASERIDREVLLMRRDGLSDTTRDNLPASWRRPLADCEAKRRIVALHDDALKLELERRDASAAGADLMHHDVLCALASVHADHPDFDPAWRL